MLKIILSLLLASLVIGQDSFPGILNLTDSLNDTEPVTKTDGDTFTVTLTKEYPNDEKILAANGNYVDNPNYFDDKENKVRSQMINEGDLIYYGDIFFWDDKLKKSKKIQVIMDTGSSWLWAPSSLCQGCPSDTSVDHTFLNNIGEGTKTIRYGSGAISGDIVRGNVSLRNNSASAISMYKLLEVTQADLPGLKGSKWDGILGLLPSAISGSNLFVTELFKSGKLPLDSFFIDYTDTKSKSEIVFGGFDKSKVKELDDFTFFKIHEPSHWSAELKRIKYGLLTEIPLLAKVAILDSGTSLVLMPTEMFTAFKGIVSQGKK